MGNSRVVVAESGQRYWRDDQTLTEMDPGTSLSEMLFHPLEVVRGSDGGRQVKDMGIRLIDSEGNSDIYN